MDCQFLENVGELYFLGATDREDSVSLGRHLQEGCPRCLDRMRQAALTVLILTQPVRPARLNPKAKSRLLRRLRRK